MAINSLKSRNWTDDQWYNFICGLIKEPSIVGPGPEPPTPTINLGVGFAYIIPPDIIRNGHRLTSANEIYFEIHVYTGQEAYAEDCVSYAYKLSLDTLELTACQLISQSDIICAYGSEKPAVYFSRLPSYARLAPRGMDISYAYLEIEYLQSLVEPTGYKFYYKNNETTDAKSVALSFTGSYSPFYDCAWFGSGITLFFRYDSQTKLYATPFNGTLSDDAFGFGVYALIQKAVYNGNMTYVGDITMGMSLHSRFIVWMYDLDEWKSYGYEFTNPKLRFCMSVAGYVYLTGDYTHRMFEVDGIADGHLTGAYFFDNTVTNESIALCVKSGSAHLVYSPDDNTDLDMHEYLATKLAASQDEISLLGLYDVAESNVGNLFNARYVAIPNTSSLTDSDHLMIITQELDGLNTFLYSISTGALTEYGTNPNVPTPTPREWSSMKSSYGVNNPHNVYPAGAGFILFSETVGNAYLAYTRNSFSLSGYLTIPLGQRLYREALVLNTSGSFYLIGLFDLNSSECSFWTAEVLSNGRARYTAGFTGAYSQTVIDRTTSDTYAIDSITSCGGGYAVFWVDETGYIFSNVQYVADATFTGTYTGKAFVITGDSGSFDGARITVHSNGNFACLYKRCDGGGSRLITATPLANDIVLS